MNKTILITGGAGFIGSHVVRLFLNSYPDYLIINVDKLTYAGNLENLADVEHKPNYRFVKADITNLQQVNTLFHEYRFDGIIHLAAESHVDRSITNPLEFIQTNVLGTVNLLNAAREGGKATTTKRSFTIFPPMKFLVRWEKKVSLRKKQPMIRVVLILPPRQAPTTW